MTTMFEPFTMGDLTLRNRVVMAPLTRSRSSDDGVPPDFAPAYYGQRATAGLIVTEATNISAQARGYAMTPGIWTAAQVASWRRVTDCVHAQGGTIVLQLWHTGRISHPNLHGGALPVAPSALKPEGQAFTNEGLLDHVVPRALETDEIPAIVEDYRHAAQCAKDAGFDGVEIHSANNYLLEQFLRDSTNRRTDQYGGSIANRMRFPLAVVEAVVGVWGGSRTGIRISPGTTQPGGTPLDSDPMALFGAYIERLNATFRARCHSLVRRGRGLARQASTLVSGMYLVGCLYNFCTPHQSLQREDGAYTPAMAAGLTHHLWSVGELLSYRFAPPPFVAKKKPGRKPKSEARLREGGKRVVTG